MKKGFLSILVACLILVSGKEVYALKVDSFEIRPFISLIERYTDNVFNTRDDVQSDFSTVISPGIEIVFPRVKRRYQLDVIYQADFERFNRFTSEDAVSHRVDGRFEIKFPVGLELRVSDRFRRSHDLRGENISPELNFYNDNFFLASASFPLTDRLKVQLDYYNYFLDYDADRVAFRDRTDNSFAAYLYYQLTPKTWAFVEYEYVIIKFRESDAFDSREHHFFGGITWDVTGKTKGTIKGGYGTKDFDDSSLEGFSDYIMELIIDHNFTPRHSLKITASRATSETNFQGSNYFIKNAVNVEYFQRLTGKITAKGNIGYANDSYRGDISRDDDIWSAGLGLLYQYKRWLLTEMGYSYTKRNSSIDVFDYRNNTFFLRITGTL